VRIDCSGLERIDSAGLAVLLDAVALARDRGTDLRYVNLPAGVLRLARLGGVDSLLPV
jgi:phospholipid transport system transporter-binding protein